MTEARYCPVFTGVEQVGSTGCCFHGLKGVYTEQLKRARPSGTLRQETQPTMIFSPQYPSYRRQQILFYYGIYRLMLASALSVLALMPLETMMALPRLNADSFLYATLAYVVICIIGLVVTVRGQMGSIPTVVLLLTDILMQSLILHYLGAWVPALAT